MPTNFWWNVFSTAFGFLIVMTCYFMFESFVNFVSKSEKKTRTGPAMPEPRHIPDPPKEIKKGSIGLTMAEELRHEHEYQQAVYNLTNKRIGALEKMLCRDVITDIKDGLCNYTRRLIYDTRYEAEHVLKRMIETLFSFSHVSVADYYAFSGQTHTQRDTRIGWFDLKPAKIKILHNKYYIELPNPREIDTLPSTSYRDCYDPKRYERIYFETRQKAEDILDKVCDIRLKYGSVTVGDYYDLVGKTAHYADMKIGWTELSTTHILRSGGGYTIDFPRPKDLDEE